MEKDVCIRSQNPPSWSTGPLWHILWLLTCISMSCTEIYDQCRKERTKLWSNDSTQFSASEGCACLLTANISSSWWLGAVQNNIMGCNWLPGCRLYTSDLYPNPSHNNWHTVDLSIASCWQLPDIFRKNIFLKRWKNKSKQQTDNKDIVHWC